MLDTLPLLTLLDWCDRRQEGPLSQNKIVIINTNILLLNSFGENTKPLPQLPKITDSIKEALSDKVLIALAVAAFFTLVAGWYSAAA